MKSLCYRCEHRAMFLEGEYRPRHECGLITSAVENCYMYRPTRPMIIKKQKGDKRVLFSGAGVSARCEGVEVADMDYRLAKTKKGYIVWCEPKGIK